ncbi:MAG: epoxyqueuosine reductase QueH, partial [Pseudobutyrivibrio sp.]|nr:epoxyqueuosine reductase QueH [Pseudobutyrivibrio sp.]
MNKINYQKELDKLIDRFQKEGRVPSLLLHSCCGPCSSYCIEYLSQFFYITVFYYNPNIYPDEEYYHRVKEQQRFIQAFPTKNPVKFIEGDY